MSVFVLTTLIVYTIFAVGTKRDLATTNITINSEQEKIRETQFFCFFLGVVLLAYVTGQRYYFGDTITYMNYFTDYSITPFEVLSNFKFGKEDIYNFLVAFIKTYISSEPRVFIEIVSFLTIIPIFYFIYNYSGDLKFVFLLFVFSGCWEHSMNGLRQCLAGAILLASFKLIYDKKWYFYFPIVIFAAQIHTSAYIFLVLYFIANNEAWGKSTKLIIGIGICLLLTFPISGKLIVSILEENTGYGQKYSNNGFDYSINIFRVLVMSVPLVVAFINRDSIKGKYKYYNTIFNMSLFCTITTLLGLVSVVYARLNLYFEIYSIVLLVWNINDMVKQEKYRWIKPVCFICFAIYFIYQMMFSHNLSWYERYLFFCNDWKDSSWI